MRRPASYARWTAATVSLAFLTTWMYAGEPTHRRLKPIRRVAYRGSAGRIGGRPRVADGAVPVPAVSPGSVRGRLSAPAPASRPPPTERNPRRPRPGRISLWSRAAGPGPGLRTGVCIAAAPAWWTERSAGADPGYGIEVIRLLAHERYSSDHKMNAASPGELGT